MKKNKLLIFARIFNNKTVPALAHDQTTSHNFNVPMLGQFNYKIFMLRFSPLFLSS